LWVISSMPRLCLLLNFECIVHMSCHGIDDSIINSWSVSLDEFPPPISGEKIVLFFFQNFWECEILI
jgi:hypothetical protein